MPGKLFGTDGIRGIAGEYPLTPSMVRAIGFHAGNRLKGSSSLTKPSIVIGRDTRCSGEWIAGELAAGLMTSGMCVRDAGVLPTPGVSFLVRHGRFSTGVVISASHNPAHHNGIKFFSPQGTKLEDPVEESIEADILKNKDAGGEGSVRPEEYAEGHPAYIDFLSGLISKDVSLKGVKIVIDCANGAACRTAPAVISRLGADVISLSTSPDGDNINRECGSQYPLLMQDAVRAYGASCGFALDGDADRVIFTDEKGSDLDGDHLLALLAEDFKAQGKLSGNLLVTTVMANLGLFRAMESIGVRVVQTAVGDRYVYEAMLKEDAVIGGEQSGHIILRDRVRTGDGIATALAVLEAIARNGRSLSEMASLVRKFPQVLLNVPVGRKVPIEKIPGFVDQADAFMHTLGRNGRILNRYSGTELLLRIMVEGPDLSEISGMADTLAGIVKKEIG